jgi:hypothetical protein
MTKTDQFVAHVGEPTAGFFYDDTDLPGLPYEQAMALRSLAAAERLEEARHQEELAERMEASRNRAIAESIQRAHVGGKQWDPKTPWEFYPSREQRVAEAFAAMDARAAAELRVAKQAAIQVLRDHGVHAQVVVDASQPAPGLVSPSVPGQPPSPSSSSASSSPAGEARATGTAARSTTAGIRQALRDWARTPRDPHPIAHDSREITTAAGRARRAAENRMSR